MSFLKKLYSRNYLILNLVLVGILIGAGVTYLGVSRASSSGAGASGAVIKAESPSSPIPANAKAALEQAEAVQGAFRYVADKVQPAVVQINVTEKVQAPKQSPQDQLPWRFFFNSPDDGSGQAQPYEEKGLGSGIIVRQDGKTVYVLTNNHVAGSASEITVVTHDDKEYKATLVGTDERRDIALVKFEADPSTISVASLGDSSAVRVGDWAIAIGNPLGLTSSVTMGIVSAVGRSGSGPDGNINDFIQTDASINKGNSGGALVNIRGEVIGVNDWIASSTGGSIGLGFAIPINNVKKAIDDFIKKGKVEYGWMGIGLDAPDKATAEELGADPKKAVIAASVFKKSPADKGGILPGDVIVKVNGEEIKAQEQLQRIVGDLPAGETASIDVLRDGKGQTIKVEIEKRNDSAAANDGGFFPGAYVRSLKADILNQDKLPKGVKGVFVVSVQDKSPASVVGLKAGDIITEVNEKAVSTVREFYAQLNDGSAKKVSFTVNRDGATVSTLAFSKK